MNMDTEKININYLKQTVSDEEDMLIGYSIKEGYDDNFGIGIVLYMLHIDINKGHCLEELAKNNDMCIRIHKFRIDKKSFKKDEIKRYLIFKKVNYYSFLENNKLFFNTLENVAKVDNNCSSVKCVFDLVEKIDDEYNFDMISQSIPALGSLRFEGIHCDIYDDDIVDLLTNENE